MAGISAHSLTFPCLTPASHPQNKTLRCKYPVNRFFFPTFYMLTSDVGLKNKTTYRHLEPNWFLIRELLYCCVQVLKSLLHRMSIPLNGCWGRKKLKLLAFLCSIKFHCLFPLIYYAYVIRKSRYV